MTTTARACKYSTGQAVEVQRTDFETEGWPRVWAPGIVESVEPAISGGRWNVHVRVGERAWSPQIVGARGGNPNIRRAAGVVPADVAGLHGNQLAAKAYQRFYFDADPHGAQYFVAMGEHIDPDQAARWSRLRNDYAGPADASASEAAPARDGSRGVATSS